MTSARVVTILVAAILLAPVAAKAQSAADGGRQDAAAASPRPLDGLAFMSGCWRGDFSDGAALEEFYTMPSANLVLGTSRFLRGARAVQFEFSRITADSAGVVVLLPYPGGQPSEHGFRLTSLDGTSALFEAPEHDFPKRIRYTLEGDGTLAARIDGGAGDERVQEWRMRPVDCTPNRARANR